METRQEKTPTGPAEVRVLRSLDDLERVREFWTAHQTHPNCDFDFYRKIITSRSSILRPHLLALYREQKPEAILAGRLDKGSVDLNLGYKKFVGFRATILTFLHGGLMGNKSAANCAQLLQSTLQSLAEGEADVAYFNHVPTHESLYTEMFNLPRSAGCRSFSPAMSHRGMSLATSGEQFLCLLSSKERNNQKRRAKRLQEEFGGQVRLCCYRSPADFETMIHDINDIAQKTYQRSLGVGFEDTPEVRQQLQLALSHGLMRAYVLYLADHPTAFWMGNVYAKTFYSGFTGYDPAYSKFAPGMFLLLKVLEQICIENPEGQIRAADFGLGDAEWKLILGDLEWQECTAFLFSPSARGRMLGIAHRAAQKLNVAGKQALERFQLLSKVKRRWRDRLSNREAGAKSSEK